MKNDDLIREKISMLQDNIDYFNSFVNPCASQDRAIENIVITAREIEVLHEERFENIMNKPKRR